MSAYERPTKEDLKKIRKRLRGNTEPTADLVLFQGGNTIDRVIMREKPYNQVVGIKKTLLRSNPEWGNLLRVISSRGKAFLNLKY